MKTVTTKLDREVAERLRETDLELRAFQIEVHNQLAVRGADADILKGVKLALRHAYHIGMKAGVSVCEAEAQSIHKELTK